MKANILAVLILLVSAFSHTVTAAPYPPYPPGIAPQVQAPAPATILKNGITKLTSFIKQGGAKDRAKAIYFLETEIAPYFDFEYMTRWSAGPAWRRMSDEQRRQMQQQLTSSFMATLVQKATNTFSPLMGPLNTCTALSRPQYSRNTGVPAVNMTNAALIVSPINPQTTALGNMPKPFSE